jgi:tetratricopeptide (TPR) repeat protein
MPRRARAAFAAVVVLAAALAAADAWAAPADRQGEMKAREAFAAGRYDEALEMFAKLYAETLHPNYLRNIGRCHQKMREPQKAIDAFHDYLAKAKKVPADERVEIDGYIKEMEALRDEQARLATLRPATPPPPPPVIAAAPPPPPPASGNPTMLALASEPQARPRADESPVYTRWWFWTIAGVVVAGGVAAALLIPVTTVKPNCPLEAMGNCR